MAHRIFETILLRKVQNFVATFVDDSKSIFYNDSQLIHPGEYGRYRENAIKDLLQIITKYKVSDGFIITSDNKTSTQCDIVIYDNSSFPVLENNLTQFFSIESVVCIGEVKSTVSKKAFTETLRKLAENKMLSSDIKSKAVVRKRGVEFDHPISFLVCKNLSFEHTKIDFNEIYKGIPKIYWHNSILIIDEGYINYSFSFTSFDEQKKQNLSNVGINKDFLAYLEVPQVTFADELYDCFPSFVRIREEDKYRHINMFIMALSQAISFKTIFETHMIYYTGFNSDDFF